MSIIKDTEAMRPAPFPPWVVLHIPHDSAEIPAAVREQFMLNDAEIERELVRMTDHHTQALYAGSAPGTLVIRAPVSRLVVDVERFPVDADEPMSGRGMGAIYTRTSSLTPLRRALAEEERAALLHAYYKPHHIRLEESVSSVLAEHGRCLVLDCHSFPSVALPYEMATASEVRPDICIGTDTFHTAEGLASAFVASFQHQGWRVSVNDPFSGALVPLSRYHLDARVSAVMVEVNRSLYMDERNGARLPNFEEIAIQVRRACATAIN